jgi:hypothetical protein
LPSVSAFASDQSICAGDPLVLNGSGALTYTWTGGAVNNTVFYPTASSAYTVTGFAANGCHNTSSVAIVVNPLPPIIIASASPTICEGEITTLVAGGGLFYLWSNGSGSGTIAVNPTVNTTYTVTGTDAEGCKNTAIMQQVVDPCTDLQQGGINNKPISVFPNPTIGDFVVDLNLITQNAWIIIYNSVGQAVLQKQITGTTERISIGKEASGIYTILVLDNASVLKRQTLVKQ